MSDRFGREQSVLVAILLFGLRTILRLTSMMVSVGYLLAGRGPFIGDGIRNLFGSYRATFLIILLVSAMLFVMTPLLTPDRRVL